MIPARSALLILALAANVFLACAGGAEAAESSGLPLPRFVSLRSDEVNMRTGPGVQYPVDWIYNRRDLPVEVIAEWDAWRKIRDWQGTEGWVHQSLLSGRRMIVVVGEARKLRHDDNDGAEPAAVLEPGVLGRLEKCPRNNAFCRIDVNGISGWLRRDEFWGVYKGEWVE